MPTPLPAVVPQDYGQTLNAYRTGMQDRIAQDERNLLKEAGGLAAAGNMKGAQSALYRGGNFAQAQNISQEQRAQSAEARAAAAHARTMKDHDLERAGKTYELFGRLIPAIKSPEQLEQAKALIKQRTGMDFSQVTMEQLPMLYQQNVDIGTTLKLEQETRKQAQEQANLDRNYDLNVRKTDIAQGLADAKAAKVGAPKPLTEGQALSRNFYGLMSDASDVLTRGTKTIVGGKPIYRGGILPNDGAESPMGASSNYLALNSPGGAVTSASLNKKQKQFIQAAMQWVRAKQRKESGATISPEEFGADYQIFFPQPGDDVQTRLNKARARKKAEEGFRVMGAMDGPSGAPDAAGGDDGASDEAFKILSVD